MKVTETSLKGVLLIEPKIFTDDRGYFMESFNNKKFNELTGLDITFTQDNESYSKYGTIRGLHYQIEPHAQTKLIRCVSGSICDVVVDIRKDSETYGQHIKFMLTGDNKKQLLIPPGFAHGFSVTSESAIIQYKVDKGYNKESERGIMYNDSNLNINWSIPNRDIIISDKDMKQDKFDVIKD